MAHAAGVELLEDFTTSLKLRENSTESDSFIAKPLPFLEAEKAKPTLVNRVSPGIYLHAIALVSTTFVVQLSLRNTFWYNDGHGPGSSDSGTLLKILQYVAKIYELVLVASLTNICVHLSRHWLIEQHGFPLGFSMIGYQIGSVHYVWSCRKNLLGKKFYWTILAAILVLYTTIIGPSSAILIVPAIDWWPVNSPFNSEPYTVVFANVANLTEFPWATTLLQEDPSWLFASCGLPNAFDLCPGTTWQQIKTWATDAFDLHSPGKLHYIWYRPTENADFVDFFSQ